MVKEALAKAGLTEEQVMADPSLAKDILYEIPLDRVLHEGEFCSGNLVNFFLGKADPNISLPQSTSHHVAIRYNPATGKFDVSVIVHHLF